MFKNFICFFCLSSTQQNWFKVNPWGIRKILVWAKEHFNNPPIFITESGRPSEAGLEDPERIYYLKYYINEVLKGNITFARVRVIENVILVNIVIVIEIILLTEKKNEKHEEKVFQIYCKNDNVSDFCIYKYDLKTAFDGFQILHAHGFGSLTEDSV